MSARRFRTAPALLSIVLIAGLALTGCGKKELGDSLPSITLKTYDGGSYTYDPEDGRVSLVVFWATWCVPCIEEIPHLKDFENTYAEQGFRVVSINIDDPSGRVAPTLMRQFEINYPVLVEEDGRAEKAFGGIRALPTSFLVGRDGTIKRKLEGLYPPATVERMIAAEL